MGKAVISATGLWTPDESISNAELVASYNSWAERWNAEHALAIESGEVEPKLPSAVEFIEKASGIKSRYTVSKDSILDPDIMAARVKQRPDDQLSLQAEVSVAAGRQTLAKAGRAAKDVDAVIVSCSNLERAYPAISIEVQEALAVEGFAWDMVVGCASAAFGIASAKAMIESGQAKSILVCNPEITSGHMNYRDRESHFIFGDVCTAVLVEDESLAPAGAWDIVDIDLQTQFSNNIRNNFGYLNRADPETMHDDDKLFQQQGRKVFRQVIPLVSEMILAQLERNGLVASDLKRMWLHQANIHMNEFIAKKITGGELDAKTAPVVLDEYANTSSAGSVIAFNKYSDDMQSGDLGLLSAFGAGYSAGSLILRKR